jgi:hypothetical protein
MRKAVIILVGSVALLSCGLAICVPGICGCAQVIPGFDGDRYFILALVFEAIGILGIVCTLIALPIVHLRKLRQNSPRS